MDNITALVSCFARAYHHRKNEVHIFDDFPAEPILGADYEKIAKSMTDGIGFFLPEFKGTAEEGLRLIVDRQLSPSVLGRSAYCEKMLNNEIGLGCGQLVIFAAGYDTYAIRNKDASLSVFELDLPEVLEDKRKRIEKAGLETSAIDVPCNLAEASWKNALLSKGYCTENKSFGSLLGISYYLSEGEFKALIRLISEIMAEGSCICFDYPSENESRQTEINKTLAHGAGESMKAVYSYGDMEALLAECGFIICEHLEHGEMTSQFFTEYNNANPEHQIEAPEGVAYVLAVRKP